MSSRREWPRAGGRPVHPRGTAPLRGPPVRIAVATSSVNSKRRDSVSSGRGRSSDEATITPQSSPSTTIGAPTEEHVHSVGHGGDVEKNRRSRRPAPGGRSSRTNPMTLVSSTVFACPVARGFPGAPAAHADCPPSAFQWGHVGAVDSQKLAALSGDSCEESLAGTPRATSVATRRSAACSAAVAVRAPSERLRRTASAPTWPIRTRPRR